MSLIEKLHQWDLRLPLILGLFLVYAYAALFFYTSVYIQKCWVRFVAIFHRLSWLRLLTTG